MKQLQIGTEERVELLTSDLRISEVSESGQLISDFFHCACDARSMVADMGALTAYIADAANTCNLRRNASFNTARRGSKARDDGDDDVRGWGVLGVTVVVAVSATCVLFGYHRGEQRR